MTNDEFEENLGLLAIECQVYVNTVNNGRGLKDFAEHLCNKYFPLCDETFGKQCEVYIYNLWTAKYTINDMRRYGKKFLGLNKCLVKPIIDENEEEN